LNTDKTFDLIKSHGIVPLKADMTHDDEMREAVEQLLIELGHLDRGIPYYAVFPGDGSPVIVFQGLVSQGTVARAIKEAGPSKSSAAGERLAKQEL
jgi:Thiol:disulfide interchange protein